MLTPDQRDIVKATVPLLETGGETLTRHFYEMLLREHPDVRPFFNQANQVDGAQQRALARGVLMYARHIDNLEALGPLVSQVINKHVSLQILPAHYPIVGACLLRSIREVLGAEVATDAVLDAWRVAYGQLADVLIQAEEARYHANDTAPGGWRGARRFVISKKVPESSEITSFHLTPDDGLPVLVHAPGQYIGLVLDIEGQSHRRNYSLSAAADGRQLRISVKRQAGGIVSTHLHEHMQVGDVLNVFPPSGEFVLRDAARPLVLLTAGVGITPAIAMLQAAPADREVIFIHCARNGAVQAFDAWIREHGAGRSNFRYHVCLSDPADCDKADARGMLDLDKLAGWLPASRDIDVYFLGPVPFMAMVKRHLTVLGVPESQAFFEFFGPAAQLA
ncbi:dihydropteridine reductase [Robbsia andropogonis]|uniref:Flavohemoprotein n=1 Tax=Robbsia andropogonis TaxID=28092 RepID=A0A0F5JYN2_9BURK|nr:NO-inducible flavohemoprotein [Robbsia andropogonis]KKB62785.1 dihydropteridine reductase [Robbsia andropogonis]